MLLKKHKNKSTKLIRRQSKAFTLIEVMIAVAILGVSAAIAIPIYTGYKLKINNAIAITDIVNIQVAAESYYQAKDVYPSSLTDVNMNLVLDPWGLPYEYLNLDGVPIGMMRKDQALVPINSDYDLYSKGPDGASIMPLTAPMSRDDIVRANNGSFIGIAADY
ncbi:MAG: prepilin-type N-terminal cleavage/methylation domain-containing protein [Proteobacteria bacterium]|nr:prepilin-type N-terminal cleavage/methylation domain-containing protein [Pseudomonadota bacterium]